MRYFFFCVLALASLHFIPSLAFAESTSDCTQKPIASGYGADGRFTVKLDSIMLKGEGNDRVYFFRPDTAGQFPCIFFCHRYGDISYEEYSHLINHLVSRGNCVIYSPARTIDFTEKQIRSTAIPYTGIVDAVNYFKTYLDTTLIGCIGHSFGAGAAPAIVYNYLTEKHWGTRGSYLYLMSPWYAYGNDIRKLRAFPSQTSLVVQIFDQDRINDPRIGLDIFNSIDIPLQRKKFLIVRSDKRGDCQLRADNFTPFSNNAILGEENSLDYYGIFRIVDGLANYAFYKDTSGYSIALGGSGARDITMGQWPDGIGIRTMLALDSPSVYFQNGLFVNNWESLRNPRIDATRFRQARKVFGGFIKKTAKLYATTIKTALKEPRVQVANLESEGLDIMPNPILHGFGADSSFGMTVDSFPRPDLPFPIQQKGWVYVFRPNGIHIKTPVLFMLHGYIGQDYQSFQPLISHIVSKGISVVYPTYPFLPKFINEKGVLDKYAYVYAGLDSALVRFSKGFDTTRIGFFGQSFGGGMVPAVAYKMIVTKHWGSMGSFMFMSAPWYSFDITPEQLASFPSSTMLLMQVYNDDWMNDHEMAVDIFNSIGIPQSQKDFVTLYTDSLDGYTMLANHFLPYGVKNMYGQLNLHDYYGVFRYFDALAAYSWYGTESGKSIALGHGSKKQCFMGTWPDGKPIRPASVLLQPKALHPELQYVYSWDNKLNPRRLVSAPVAQDSLSH